MITLSALGGPVSLAALLRAVLPEVAVDQLHDGWPFDLWPDHLGTERQERFLLFLEWLVLSDATSARYFVEVSSKVLTPDDVWRASGAFAADPDPATKALLLRLARDRFFESVRSEGFASGEAVFTRSQAAAYRRVVTMARMYFEKTKVPCSIAPRLAPLLIGPTGVGKSSLLRRAAEEQKATFIRTSVGEWIVMGVREGRPTLAGVLEVLATSPVVLFVDELDKVVFDGSAWNRSVMAEIFALLDRSVPREAFTYLKDCSISREEFKARIEGQLFFAGAGTWQKLWEGGGALGFGAPKDKTTQVVDRVAAEKIVPVELLMRFAWPPIVLEFPGPDESVDLFNKTGLSELAALAGVTLDPAKHNWARGGMRSLESLAGDLLLRLHEHPEQINTAPASA